MSRMDDGTDGPIANLIGTGGGFHRERWNRHARIHWISYGSDTFQLHLFQYQLMELGFDELH